MTQADNLDLGFPFPDTHREIRALTATGMDEAQAEAIVYTTIRVSAATTDVRLSATMDTKFREVPHAIERVEKDVKSIKKNVEDGVGIEKRREDSGRFLGSASLILSSLAIIIATVPIAD